MPDSNHVEISGRVVDVERKQTQRGTDLCKFGIEIENERKTMVVPCIAWAKVVPDVAMCEGERAIVTGHINVNEWTKQETGKTYRFVEVNAEGITRLGGVTAPETVSPADVADEDSQDTLPF